MAMDKSSPEHSSKMYKSCTEHSGTHAYQLSHLREHLTFD